MGTSPLVILAIIALTLVFEGLLFGSEIEDFQLPQFEEPKSGGFFAVLDALLSIVQVIWGVVLFFFNLVTFNVPGAPWYIRVPVGTMLTGGLVWSIATLIRGN